MNQDLKDLEAREDEIFAQLPENTHDALSATLFDMMVAMNRATAEQLKNTEQLEGK